MRNSPLPSALLLAAMTLLLTSCSRNPVAPGTSLPGSPGATTMGGSQEQEPSTSPDGGTPNVASIPLTISEEGTITAGRFTLWVRKNSIRVPCTIRLTVADPEAMEALFEVFPPEANDFQSPVVVTANLSDVPSVDYETEWMWYWDGGWQEGIYVSAHPNQENVVWHADRLSACKVGPKDDKWKNKLQE